MEGKLKHQGEVIVISDNEDVKTGEAEVHASDDRLRPVKTPWPLQREQQSSADPELFQALKAAFNTQRLRRDKEVWFCRGCDVTYFQQNTTFTCSYASTQMITSALLSIEDDSYRQNLFYGANLVPSVTAIQVLIETAWGQGFDVEGSRYFDASLVGKATKIGASDIAALLRANHVPTRIFDFDHGKRSWKTVESFCYQYFTSKDSELPSKGKRPRFPLILGYAEHTIVVVGCARDTTSHEINLIVLDPGAGVHRAKKAVANNPTCFYAKRGYLATWEQFQILAVGPFDGHVSYLIKEESPMSCASKVLFALRPTPAV